MLKDHVRTNSYRNGIFESAGAIKDKIVRKTTTQKKKDHNI